MTQIYLTCFVIDKDTGFVIDKDINKLKLICTIEMDLEMYVLQYMTSNHILVP